MKLRIPHITILLFSTIILIGAGLLSLPMAQKTPISFIDTLFTATSAVCVTGLLTIDVAHSFTLFGQMIIMVLIELGGIGIITISAALMLMTGKGVSHTHSSVIHDTFTASREINIKQLVKSVVVFMIGFELLGALLFFFFWAPQMGGGPALFHSLFHSISAFCNAGITSFDNGLTGLERTPFLDMVFIFLFVAGGLGFLTITEVVDWGNFRLKNRRMKRRKRWVWSLQTRIILVGTFVSILGGAAMMFMLESHGSQAGQPVVERVVSSLFHTASARTAGFATVDIAEFSNVTLYIFILLMFVGGGPVSTAGGIKVTTFAIFIGMALSRMRGSKATMLYNRSVTEEVVSRSISITIIALALLTVSIFLLLITESWGDPLAAVDRNQFMPIIFEAVSAFGTVGLSMGVTPDLSEPGKMIVALLMFLGRLGPLTVAVAISADQNSLGFRYAEESVMVG